MTTKQGSADALGAGSQATTDSTMVRGTVKPVGPDDLPSTQPAGLLRSDPVRAGQSEPPAPQPAGSDGLPSSQPAGPAAGPAHTSEPEPAGPPDLLSTRPPGTVAVEPRAPVLRRTP
jgi:hypothetical protein